MYGIITYIYHTNQPNVGLVYFDSRKSKHIYHLHSGRSDRDVFSQDPDLFRGFGFRRLNMAVIRQKAARKQTQPKRPGKNLVQKFER